MNQRPERVAALLLAAGAATRMGRLKQLLAYHGRTLVAHAAGQAIEAGFNPLIVITGAHGEKVQEALASLPAETVWNHAWQTGMGSSIAAGMRHLPTDSASAVAILLTDQPLVSAAHLKQMSKLLHDGPARIVAAEYNGTLGAPALFRHDLFDQLLALPPQVGARHLLRGERSQIIPYPLPEAAIDLDTPGDFAALVAEERDHNI